MDAVARELRRAARDPDVQLSPVGLAQELLGSDAVRTVPPEAMDTGGALIWVCGGWRIYLREDVVGPRRRFIVCHELAHWALGTGASEQQCDALAAALLVPRSRYLSAMRKVGPVLPRLAKAFGAAEACVGLRYGELTGTPVAVSTPRRWLFKGNWPSPFSGGASVEYRSVRLTDDPDATFYVLGT